MKWKFARSVHVFYSPIILIPIYDLVHVENNLLEVEQ